MTSVSRLGSRPGRLLESECPSPGELRKILLALGVNRGIHLLAMDEPTNHLDLPGIECLEEALEACPCAMILVSHDRRFLSQPSTAEWRLAPGGRRRRTGTAGEARLRMSSAKTAPLVANEVSSYLFAPAPASRR